MDRVIRAGDGDRWVFTVCSITWLTLGDRVINVPGNAGLALIELKLD